MKKSPIYINLKLLVALWACWGFSYGQSTFSVTTSFVGGAQLPVCSSTQKSISIDITNTSGATQNVSGKTVVCDLLYGVTPSDQNGTQFYGTSSVTAVINPGSTSVTIADPANINASKLKFILPASTSIPNGSTLVITFAIVADCRILATPPLGNDIRKIRSEILDGLTVLGNDLSPKTYSLYHPILNLADPGTGSTANIVVSGVIGNDVVRKIPINNAATAAPTSSINFRITYDDLSAVSPGTLKVFRVDPVHPCTTPTCSNGVTPSFTISGNEYLYTISSSNLNDLEYASGEFSALDRLRVEETVKIIGCKSGTNMEANYQVEWGCNLLAGTIGNTVCNINDNNAKRIGDIKQSVSTPKIITSPLQHISQGTFCSTSASEVKIEYENTGTSALDKALDVHPVVTVQGLTVSKVSLLTVGGTSYTDVTAYYSGSTLDPSLFPSDLDGASFGYDDLDADGKFDDLPAGQKITLKVEYSFPGCTSVAACSLLNRKIQATAEYYPPCKPVQSANIELLEDVEIKLAEEEADGPVDMIPGSANVKTFTFSPHIQIAANTLMKACGTSNYRVELTLPANYSFPSTPVVSFDDGTGPQTISPTGTGPYYLSGLGTNGTYSVDLQLNCNTPVPSDGFANIDWKFLASCTTGTCICERTLACATYETYSHYDAYCPGGSGGTGTCSIRSTSFLAERTSYGYDEALTGKSTLWVDGDIASATVATAGSSSINKKAVYECDVITVTVNGSYGNSTCSPAAYKYEDAHVKVYYRPISGSAELMEYVTGTAKLDFGAGDVAATATAVNYNSTDNVLEYDFHLASNTTSLPSSGTIKLTASFKVKKEDALPSNHRIKRFRGVHYFQNGSGTLGSESWGDRFNIYRPTVTVSDAPINQGVTPEYLCGQKRRVTLTVTGGSSGDDFPNEFRSIAKFNKITVSIPPEYTYVTSSAKIYTSVSGTPISMGAYSSISGTVATGYTLTWNRANNWPLLDKYIASTQMYIEYEITPNCVLHSTGNFETTLEHTYHDYSTITQCLDQNFVNGVSGGSEIVNADPRRSPDIKIDALEQSNNSITQRYEVTVINNGGQSLNSWFAFEVATADLTKIQLNGIYTAASGGTLLSTTYGPGGKFLVVKPGSLPGYGSSGSVITYWVDVTFLSCDENTYDYINIYSGWNCGTSNYPTFGSTTYAAGLSTVTCRLFSDQLPIRHNQTSLVIDPTFTNATPIDMCGTATLSQTITNAGLTPLTNVYAIMSTLPAGLTIASTAAVTYTCDASSVGCTSYTVPVTISPSPSGTYTWNLTNAVTAAGVTALGLNDHMTVTFSVTSSCTYDPGKPLIFTSVGTNSCAGVESAGFATGELNITGLDPIIKNKTIDMQITTHDFPAANTSALIDVDITNTSPSPSSPPYNPIKVNVILPPELGYDAFLPTATVGTPPTKSGNTLTWTFANNTFSSNSSPTSPFHIKFYVKQIVAISNSRSVTINGNVKLEQSIACGTSAPCSVVATADEANDDIKLNPFPTTVKCDDCIGSFAPKEGKKYVLSVWVKEVNHPGVITYDQPSIQLDFTTGGNSVQTYTFVPIAVTDRMIDGWQRMEREFTVPNAEKLNVKLVNMNNSSTKYDVLFDDIRIHPFDANMKTYVYDPKTLRLMAEHDERNYSTFYQYDEEGGLIRVAKETKTGIPTIKETRTNVRKSTEEQ